MRGDLNLVRRRGRFLQNAARRAPPGSFQATTGTRRPSCRYCRRANQAREQEQTEETEAVGNLEIRNSGLRGGRIEEAGGGGPRRNGPNAFSSFRAFPGSRGLHSAFSGLSCFSWCPGPLLGVYDGEPRPRARAAYEISRCCSRFASTRWLARLEPPRPRIVGPPIKHAPAFLFRTRPPEFVMTPPLLEKERDIHPRRLISQRPHPCRRHQPRAVP